jgi:hypothetical protein
VSWADLGVHSAGEDAAADPIGDRERPARDRAQNPRYQWRNIGVQERVEFRAYPGHVQHERLPFFMAAPRREGSASEQ